MTELEYIKMEALIYSEPHSKKLVKAIDESESEIDRDALYDLLMRQLDFYNKDDLPDLLDNFVVEGINDRRFICGKDDGVYDASKLYVSFKKHGLV